MQAIDKVYSYQVKIIIVLECMNELHAVAIKYRATNQSRLVFLFFCYVRIQVRMVILEQHAYF